MDADLRQSERDGDPLRAGILLRRAGRVLEALDKFEAAWREGEGPVSEDASEHIVELILSRPDPERLVHAERLDRLARAGLAKAETLLSALFPAAATIVGRSQAMQGLRAFLFREAAGERPVVLWGESGVGHALAARTLHALSGRGSFHEGYGPRSHALFRREVEREPLDGGTLYVSYATEGQGWEPFVLDACRRRNLRLVVGAVGHTPPQFFEDAASQFIPPLRDRFEDLPDLLRELLTRAGAGHAASRIHPEDVRRLQWHDWPGNVRELANHVSRAVMSSAGEDDVSALLLQGLFGLPGDIAENVA